MNKYFFISIFFFSPRSPPFREGVEIVFLLVQCQSYIHSAGYGATYHRVVTDAEEAHHLYVCRNGARTCELCVAVHTAESIGHTVGSRTCSHVIRVQRTARTAARCNAEIRFAGEDTLFLVRTCYRVLEAGRVGRVTGDGYIHVLMPENSYTLAYVVCTVAVNLRTRTVAVRFLAHDLQFAREIVELGLYIGKSVDTADDHSSVFAQTVQDAAERVLTHLVRHLGNLDSTLSGCEGLVACQESEALGLLAQQTGSQITVTNTYLAVVSHRTRDTEGLQTDTDSLGSVSGVLAAFLQRDSGTYYVSPLGVLKTNTLGLLAEPPRWKRYR